MARIRNIKPDYFRHEQLQDLEVANAGAYIMLIYIALWTMCDKNGVFPWRPRTMRLDILPFIPYDLENALDILSRNNYIQSFEKNGEKYGYIPTFTTHQVLTTKEQQSPSKYPAPPKDITRSDPEQTRGNSGSPEIGNRNKEIGSGSNARAHEDGQNQKEKPLPDQLITTITAWAETDDGIALLKAWKRDTGYSDRTHGPTTGELRKFVAHHLIKNRERLTADPIAHFTEQFPGWLANATQFNRPKKATPTNNTPPPAIWEPPPNGYNRTATKGNATPTIIGDIAGKIITEI